MKSMLILSREVGHMGSSNFEAAQNTSICERLKEPMLIFSREGGQRGSATFVAAPIISISGHLVVRC